MDGFIGGFLAVFFICLTAAACYIVGRVYDHKEIMAGVREVDPPCERLHVDQLDPHKECCGTIDHTKCCGIRSLTSEEFEDLNEAVVQERIAGSLRSKGAYAGEAK